DMPSAARGWKHLLDEDPDDLEAAIQTARVLINLGTDPKIVLNAISRTSITKAKIRDSRARLNPAQLDWLRCSALFRAQRFEKALAACNAAMEIDPAYGSGALAKILLAMGKNKEALVQADLYAKSPGSASDRAGALLMLGLAQQANGLDKDALATWNVALARPGDEALAKAVAGPSRSILEWQ